MTDCIFCKIRDGEIPSSQLHEDDLCLAFEDIHPAAPHHVVIIPREHVASLNDLGAGHKELVGHMLAVAASLADKLGFGESGYRVVANCNADGGQEVFHVHFHLLGGRKLSWPPG